MKYLLASLLTSILLLSLPVSIQAQDITQERVQKIESRLDRLSRNIPNRSESGIVLILFGAFCALWAQNTNRNPWLWFFMGFLFSIFTVLVLLAKNGDGNNDSRDNISRL